MTCHSRRDLALRYAKGSTPAPVAATAQPSNPPAGERLRTGQNLGEEGHLRSLCHPPHSSCSIRALGATCTSCATVSRVNEGRAPAAGSAGVAPATVALRGLGRIWRAFITSPAAELTTAHAWCYRRSAGEPDRHSAAADRPRSSARSNSRPPRSTWRRGFQGHSLSPEDDRQLLDLVENKGKSRHATWALKICRK